jgi:hypothetical protein
MTSLSCLCMRERERGRGRGGGGGRGQDELIFAHTNNHFPLVIILVLMTSSLQFMLNHLNSNNFCRIKLMKLAHLL